MLAATAAAIDTATAAATATAYFQKMSCLPARYTPVRQTAHYILIPEPFTNPVFRQGLLLTIIH
jgi:hypothetical protein